MTEDRPRFLAITGPTTSGKTSLSLALAERGPVEVVSMDSRQVYAGMDIGTDKVDADARTRVPHHGLDLIRPDERYSAGRFARDARRWIGEIEGRGALPILAGGGSARSRGVAPFRSSPAAPASSCVPSYGRSFGSRPWTRSGWSGSGSGWVPKRRSGWSAS